jgi:hypothetical protein
MAYAFRTIPMTEDKRVIFSTSARIPLPGAGYRQYREGGNEPCERENCH